MWQFLYHFLKLPAHLLAPDIEVVHEVYQFPQVCKFVEVSLYDFLLQPESGQVRELELVPRVLFLDDLFGESDSSQEPHECPLVVLGCYRLIRKDPFDVVQRGRNQLLQVFTLNLVVLD